MATIVKGGVVIASDSPNTNIVTETKGEFQSFNRNKPNQGKPGTVYKSNASGTTVQDPKQHKAKTDNKIQQQRTATEMNTEMKKFANAQAEDKPIAPSIMMNDSEYRKRSAVINPNDAIGKVKQALIINNRKIGFDGGAHIIVGELRKIYFTSLSKPGGYDLEMLTYLDKILFDPLIKMIAGIIYYGSVGVDISIIKGFIKNALDVVEFQTDSERMYAIIDRIYEEF